MRKKLVFISHIHEESELVSLFSKTINKIYLGMFDIFISSMNDSLPSGSRWIDSITSALNSSVIQLVFCSSYSIYRPWINFESGAAWIRKIPVIPICHSGLSKDNLPIPLRLFQACDIESKSDLTSMFSSLSSILGCDHPADIDYDEIIKYSNNFSRYYNYYSHIKESLDKLEEIKPGIIENILNQRINSFILNITDHQKIEITPYIDFLLNNNFIRSNRVGLGVSSNGIPLSTQAFDIIPVLYQDAKRAYNK